MDPTAALVLLLASLPLTVGAAWSDMRSMILSNRLVLATVFVFVVVGPVVLPLEAYLWRLLAGVATLALAFAAFSIGLVRGGDAKYLSALVPYIAPAELMLAAQILGIVGLAALVTHRAFARIPAIRRATPHWLSWRARRHFPYGLVLSGAQIMYLFSRALG